MFEFNIVLLLNVVGFTKKNTLDAMFVLIFIVTISYPRIFFKESNARTILNQGSLVPGQDMANIEPLLAP